MKTIGTIALALTAALALSACDPYTDENTGQGQILSVFTSSQSIATVDGTRAASGAWTVSGVTDDGGAWPVTWVRFDKLLDGFSIQATPSSCLPATGLGLTVTETTAGYTLPTCGPGTTIGGVAGGVPPAWFACYVPNTATTDEGAGVVFYLGCEDISSTGTGWNDNSILQNGATYHITANVKDKQARNYPLDITVLTQPGDNALVLGTATATTQPLTWDLVDGTTTYDVQRAPNVPAGTPPADAPGTFANLAGATGLTAAAFTDTTVTTGAKFWYRIVSHTANGLTRTSNEELATIP